jgi:hypothetical protein
MTRSPNLTGPSPVRVRVRVAARASVGAAALALLMLAALHVLRADLAPAGHMISEYAIGAYGWVMTVSFAAFAVSSASLSVAVASCARTLLARIGLAFLVLATLGLVLGAAFPTDPASTPHDAMSFAGRMHGVGFMIGVPGELLSVLLLSLALRKQAPWRSSPLVAVVAAMWLSLGAMVPLIITQTGFGIPNRTFMASFAVWLIVAARPIARESES